MKRGKQDILFYGFCYFFLCLFGVLMVYPFIWMLLSTFKESWELYIFPPTLFPKKFTLANYREVLNTVPFSRYYLNSLFVTTCTVISTLFTSSLAGFAFAKYKFRGKRLIFKTLLSGMMIPYPVTIIPLYIMVFSLGLVDTYFALIVTGVAGIFGTFLMRQFILGIPDDLLDAARIDGCSEFGIYWRIILPSLKQPLSALAIFSFMSTWNAFLWPLLVVNRDELRTVQLGIQYFTQQYGSLVHLQLAAAAMGILPILVLYLILQRHFIQGITLTGLKE